MTVRELIAALEELPEDLEVLLSSDSEGNRYGLLSSDGVSSVNNAYSDEDGEYDLQVGLLTLDDKHIAEGYSEDDVIEGGTPCVILYPN